MPPTMRALQLIAPGRRQLRDVPTPLDLAAHEVLVRVDTAGICGTDLELNAHPDHFATLGCQLPLTLGHEFSGWVHAAGPDASWTVGQFVVPYGMRGCGACIACQGGEENLCIVRPPVLGIGRDGGLAEFVRVDSADLVSADGVPPIMAACMTDGGMTAYAAADRVSPYLRGDRLVVALGVGGIGHLAVQFLSSLHGARVIAVDIDSRRLALAQSLGAWRCVAFDEARESLADLAAGGQIDAVIDIVGTSASLRLARDVVRPGGTVRLVGTANGEIPFSFFSVPRGTAFVRSSGGTRQDLCAALEAGQKGTVSLNTVTFEFDEAEEAFSRFEAGTLLGRAMIRMPSAEPS